MSTEPVITIIQGETIRLRVRIRAKASGLPVDLTGAVITSQIRKTYTAEAVEGAFDIEPDDLAAGSFFIVLDEAASNEIPSGRHVFDVRIELTAGVVKKRPRGQLNILPGVTRE